MQSEENQNTEPVDLPPVTGPYTEPWSLKKITALASVFGPAAIVASVSIGAGETIVVVRTGAWAGYNLLWLVLLSCVVKGIFVTYLLGRYTAVSGEYIGNRLAKLPGPRGWLLIAIVIFEMVGAPLAWVPIGKPCGALLHHLFKDALPSGVAQPVWENLITILLHYPRTSFSVYVSPLKDSKNSNSLSVSFSLSEQLLARSWSDPTSVRH